MAQSSLKNFEDINLYKKTKDKSGNSNFCRHTSVNILNLPTELLESIFRYLSFHEIAAVREVCIQFSLVGKTILNKAFIHFLTEVESRWFVARDELTPIKDAVVASVEEKNQQPLLSKCYLLHARRLWILQSLNVHMNILKATCYRYFCKKSSSNVYRNQFSFYGGVILDMIRHFFSVTELSVIERKQMSMEHFAILVDKWISHFHDKVESWLVDQCLEKAKTVEESAGYRRSFLYGSKVVDLLDCWVNSERYVDVTVDKSGWCLLRGKYRLPRTLFSCLTSSERVGGVLTPAEQVSLHECLRLLATRSGEYLLLQQYVNQENVLACGEPSWDFTGIYEGFNECLHTAFSYGCFSDAGFYKKFGTDSASTPDDMFTVVRVDLLCRWELAPLQVLLTLSLPASRQRYAQPDLRLRLRFSCPLAASLRRPLPSDYDCLVEQNVGRRRRGARTTAAEVSRDLFVQKDSAIFA